MISLWTDHLKTDQEKAEFADLLRNSSRVFSRLEEILAEKLSRYTGSKESDYDSPSWAYKQADANGYIRCLRDLEKLIASIYEGTK